jgi:hypothetical protein
VAAAAALLAGSSLSCAPRPGDDSLAAVSSRLPAAVAAWRVVDEERRFDRETIFSYLDGVAEVYLAYGMEACSARRYRGPDGQPDLVLDLFRMASAEDAYGVLTWDQEGEAVAVGQGGLLRPGWLAAWKGRYFISVYAEGQSEQASSTMLELGRAVAAAIVEQGTPPALVRALPLAGREERSVRYLRDAQVLAAQLGRAPDDSLPLAPGARVALARYRRADGEARLLVMSAPSVAAAEQARVAVEGWLARLGCGAAGCGARQRGDRVAVVLDATGAELVESLLREALAEGDDGSTG